MVSLMKLVGKPRGSLWKDEFWRQEIVRVKQKHKKSADEQIFFYFWVILLVAEIV